MVAAATRAALLAPRKPTTTVAMSSYSGYRLTLPTPLKAVAAQVSGDTTSEQAADSATTGISGYVYVDTNNNGVKDSWELPMGGRTVCLSTQDDPGHVLATSVTDSLGSYKFSNLVPGMYSVTQYSQPVGFIDGLETVGQFYDSQGNLVTMPAADYGHALNDQSGVDAIQNINLAAGYRGANYNCGELSPQLATVSTRSLLGSTPPSESTVWVPDSVTPEPATWALLGAGVATLTAMRVRRRGKRSRNH
jgi:hypothetical protein